jgi:hypothetical protein
VTIQQHPIDQLFDQLADVGPYPPGVLPTTARIPGTAFFPGGTGLWGTQPGQPLPLMPLGGVMVLGHNFDSAASYAQSLARGSEHINGPSWRPLLTLLRACAIDPSRCFFTNAYMGLKADTASPIGKFPGAAAADFVRRCQTFLLEQLRMQQPRLVLTLGKEVPPVLAPLAPELSRTWSGALTLQELDRRAVALVYPVHFPGILHATAVAAVTHPANRTPNVARRHYTDWMGKDWVGDAAERAILHDALACVGAGLFGGGTA